MDSRGGRPNLSLIASRLEVSVATVSNALSGKGRVSPELALKIRRAANDLGYVPTIAGRALRTGRSHVLGLVLPDIANPLFPQIAQAIERAAAEAGYGVLIADSRNEVSTQTEVIGRLLERGVDGLVIVPRRGTRVSDIGSPVAVIDSPSTPGNTVSADHWQGGQAVSEHLVALGHRKFLLLGNNPASNVQNDRIGGMKSRLPPGAECRVIWAETVEARHGPGGPLGLAPWAREGFTACAAVSDLLALRALTELLGAGIVVPRGMSVTGFDDLIWARAVRPALTTIRMDMPAIAMIAVRALTAAIEGGGGQGGPVMAPSPETARVPMRLLIRDSSTPPGQTSKSSNGGIPE